MIRLTLFIGILSSFIFSQQLRIDSVRVDSIWNSDSSWYDGTGIFHQRLSRDCLLSFQVAGEGMAQCSLVVSIDSGKTWAKDPKLITVLDNSLSSLVACQSRIIAKLRVEGDDRPNVAFRVFARQYQPILAGSPLLTIVKTPGVLTPGSLCSASLNCKTNNASLKKGYSSIIKVWWDTFGDGSWNDSTNNLNLTWQTIVPTGNSGQRRAVIVKARDLNGLWSNPETLVVQFGLEKPLNMIAINGGTFRMGARIEAPNYIEEPAHTVTLSSFSMSQTLVTQEMFIMVMGTNTAKFNGDTSLLRPVERLGWDDAVLFCNALSKLAGKDTVYTYTSLSSTTMPGSLLDHASSQLMKNGYRLPTEAEWEYACKAGTTTDYYWGKNCPPLSASDTAILNSNAVWKGNSNNMTQLVASKNPNPWGLYDMVGNVGQYCNDYYSRYDSIAQIDPVGPNYADNRVVRGGDYGSSLYSLTSTCRSSCNPGYYPRFFGFRIVSRP